MNLFDRLCFHRILLLRCLVSLSRNLCTLLRKHLIGHDHISGIHRGLVGGFAPDLCFDVFILLLVVDLVNALHKGDAEVELAALDGGLLNLAEAGLHARVAGWHDGHRLEQQEGHEDDSEQGKYSYVPAWVLSRMVDSNEQNAIFVNAIDGTIINLENSL